MFWTDEELQSMVAKSGRRPSLGLVRAMTEGWHLPRVDVEEWSGTAPRRLRRAAIAADFAGDMLVIPIGRAPWRTSDLTYHFRPGSNFMYLVGDADPGSVLVIDGAGAPTLFVDERPALGHPLAYLDTARGAVYDGQPEPLSATSARLGVDARPIEELESVLKGAGRVRAVRGLDAFVDALVPDDKQELERQLSRRRLIKDDYEIDQLRDVAAATEEGFRAVARALPDVLEQGEPLVEALFTQVARTRGRGVAYTPVCCGGSRSTIMHWFRNDMPIKVGEILLLDAGVEGTELYASDVARVFPVSGRFTPEQRDLHDVISAAHGAVIDTVRPGATFEELGAAAADVLVDGLRSLGVLPNRHADGLADDVLARRWLLHGIGHMVGLDVHDSLVVTHEYMTQPLVEGHVLALEPGLYLSQYDEYVPAGLRGLGMRIEDDVVVTADGCEVLTAGLPTTTDGVEDWIGSLS